MAVQPQTPYKEYTANGSTKSFALEFDCDNQDHLIVLVDDVEAIVGTWSLSNGAVVFGNAPAAHDGDADFSAVDAGKVLFEHGY